jgi:hypothetical protein
LSIVVNLLGSFYFHILHFYCHNCNYLTISFLVPGSIFIDAIEANEYPCIHPM